jgi:AraC-like DNA-binding protein
MNQRDTVRLPEPVAPVQETTVRKTVALSADGDVANELLRDLRIASSVLCRSVMAPPWGFGIANRDVGSFHMVVDGGGWLEVDGLEGPIALRPGDLAVLPHGSAHWVKDAPATKAPALTSILARHEVIDGELRFGGDHGPPTEIVCGVFALEGGPRTPWMSRLPPVVLSAARRAPDDWRAAVVEALRNEARSPTTGGAAIVNRLLETLLADALRTELSGSEGEVMAPADALTDHRIGSVLARLHEIPEADWRIESLAKLAAMSRSAFSDRFRSIVGQPPMRYLTALRLSRAARLLRSGDMTVAEIARKVGYASAESLSRAFKARFRDPPGTFRRRARTSVGMDPHRDALHG